MSSETVITVRNLSKCYQIYEKPVDRLKQFLLPRLQRWMGRSVKIYYHDFWALKDVTFEIAKGETVGIIGRNGSGKSTLLQMICGTLNPTAGTITTKGRVAALLELGSGFNPDFTGKENVFLCAALYGLSEQQTTERLEKILAFADIGDFADQPVKTYSSGMFVRLAFAVVAHVDADILVIDEALAVGDAYFVQKCMRFLRAFNEHGTLLFVSHDVNAVLGLCSKALLLDAGHIKRIGKPKDVSEYYLAMLHDELLKSAPGPEQPDMPQPTTEMDTTVNKPLDSEESTDFGTGAASVLSVDLFDGDGQPLAFVTGGETICMDIVCRAHVAFNQPLIGFLVRDRLGQVIFGANTAGASLVGLGQDQTVRVRFTLTMPCLQHGEYSVSAAIGQGELEEHIHHQWRHDALVFNCVAPKRCFGLMAADIKDIAFLDLTEDVLSSQTKGKQIVSHI